MNIVLIPLADGQSLALELEDYREALARGRELVPTEPQADSASPTEVLDAAGMEQRTGVPASWWLESARRKDNPVPHFRAGKYVRFNLADALAVLKKR